MALKKIKEHNLESWILFTDSFKPLDQVTRETLWKFKKFGIPPNFIWINIALHRIILQLSIDGAEAEIESIVGVKQVC